MLVDPLRRLARHPLAAAVAALSASVAVVLAPGTVGAASGTKTTFAAVYDRSAVVVVATVIDAPAISAGYRLSVERVLKGTAAATLTFAPDPKAVALVPGRRIVLLLTDPNGLDFRGTTVLLVSPDGSIDPDGLAAVPATIAALEASRGGPSPSMPSTATVPPAGAPAGAPAGDPVSLLVLVAASLAVGAALVLVQGILADRHRA
jgi:hypothetical protein